MTLKRVEIWDDLKCASGTHQANIPEADLIDAELREKIDGTAELQLKISRATSVWSEIEENRVLRAVYDDDSVEEYRITKPAQSRGKRGDKLATIEAESILLDLNVDAMVYRIEADGTVTLFYTYLSQTRDQLVTHIMSNLPAHFVKGTIDDSTTVVSTFTFDHDTPLKALRELAEVENLELAIRRNGDTDYRVDLLDQVGSTATTPEFRFAKNLMGIQREIDATELANRIWPGGGSDGAIRLHVGKARWEVTNVASLVVTLAGTPIYRDDHLVNYYAETPDGNFWQITDSDATNQTITLETGHTAQTGDLIWFRELVGTVYHELAYVEDAVSQQTYGVKNAATEENDIPYVNNRAPNSAFRNWDTTDVPSDWESEPASPSTGFSITENALAEYTRVGNASVKVIALAAGEGIKITTPIAISPIDPMIYFSGFCDVWVESGAVEFYWYHDEEGRFPEEGHKEAAYTTATGEFIRLSIEGKEYPTSVSSGYNNEVTLYVVSKGGAATFYVDAVQFTNTAGNYDFFEENAANELWRRAFVTLDERSTPAIRYGIDVLDLTAIDSSTWPYDAITLGGDVYVYDDELAIEATVRCVGTTRDLMSGHNIKLELSNKPDDIIDILLTTKRRTAVKPSARPSTALIAFFDAALSANSTVVLKFIGAGSTRSYRYTVSTSSMPTIAEVTASGTASNEVTGEEVQTSTQLDYGQRAFVRVVSFPQLDGNGVAGETSTDLAGPPVYWYPSIDSSDVTQLGDGGDSGGATVKRTFTVTNRQTAAVRLFRRLSTALSPDAYPTTDGAFDSPLDFSYDRGPIDAKDGWSYQDGGYVTDDVVWDIGIPIDDHGLEYIDDPDDREYGYYEVTGTTGGGAGDPYIESMTLIRSQNGTGCSIGARAQYDISWVSQDYDSTHEVILQRRFGGGSWEDITPTGGLSPTDSVSGDEVPAYVNKTSGENMTVSYSVSLRLNVTPFTVYDAEIRQSSPTLMVECPT